MCQENQLRNMTSLVVQAHEKLMGSYKKEWISEDQKQNDILNSGTVHLYETLDLQRTEPQRYQLGFLSHIEGLEPSLTHTTQHIPT